MALNSSQNLLHRRIAHACGCLPARLCRGHRPRPAGQVAVVREGPPDHGLCRRLLLGIEAVFSHTKGVTSAVSGYHGGSKADAVYEHRQRRRHRPCRIGQGDLRSQGDPLRPAAADLLLGRRRSDHAQLPGPGPRHAIPQRAGAAERRADRRSPPPISTQLGKSGVWNGPIVTKIEAYKAFYPAETYHQDFMLKNPKQGYIVRWDAPKVARAQEDVPGASTAPAIAEGAAVWRGRTSSSRAFRRQAGFRRAGAR